MVDGPDDRVLPGGDPEAVQLGLGVRGDRPRVRARCPVGRRRSTRSMAALVERPARRPVRIALDPSARRDPAWPADPASSSARLLTQAAVAVAVRQERRPIRHDRVEVLAARRAVREVAHVPAAADDPVVVRVRRGIGPDRRAPSLGRPRVVADVALAARSIPPCVGWTWASWKPGSDGRPASSTTRVRGPIRSATLGIGSDGDDPPAADRDRFGPRSGGDRRCGRGRRSGRGRRLGRRHGPASIGARTASDAAGPAPPRRRGRDAPRPATDAYHPRMATVHLLHAGYIRDEPRRQQHHPRPRRRRDHRADPGLVASALADPRPAGGAGVDPEAVTHVFLATTTRITR